MSSDRRARLGLGIVSANKRKRNVDVSLSVQERIDAEKALLMQDRQAHLESVVDKHDDLVRESFHLDQFVSLLSYDPKVAKADTSSVFRDYKANYDLFNKYTASDGPSRRTRRAQTELSEYIKSSVQTRPKPRRRRPATHAGHVAADSSTELWKLLAEAKHKGKEAKSVDPPQQSISTPIAKDGPGLAPVGKAKDMAVSGPPILDGVKNVVGKRSLSTAFTPRKKRKIGQRTSEVLVVDSTDLSSQLPLPGNSVSALRGGRTRQPKATVAPAVPPVDSKPAEKSMPFLRKIKLIVRRPVPTFSHPRQKPPPPRYDEFISKFLSSYISLHDGKDDDVSVLETTARRDAAILDKRERLRKQGRLIVRYEDDYRTQTSDDSALRSHDVWQSIVDLIAARDPTESTRERNHVTSQITTRIKAYWDVQAAKQEKYRALEEKRLRSLAKETIRLVVNEWKRAVLFIKEQQQLAMEAEERKRGHLHLDAILDQSGQILEAQQIELAKNDSQKAKKLTNGFRSFVPGASHSELEHTDSEDLDEESEQEDENDLADESEEEEEDDEEGTMNLLGAETFMEVLEHATPPPVNTENSPDHLSAMLDDEDRQTLVLSPRSPFDDRLSYPPTPVMNSLEMYPTTPGTQNSDQDDRDPARITSFFPSYPTSPQDLPSSFDDFSSPVGTPGKHYETLPGVTGSDTRPSRSGSEIIDGLAALAEPGIVDDMGSKAHDSLLHNLERNAVSLDLANGDHDDAIVDQHISYQAAESSHSISKMSDPVIEDSVQVHDLEPELAQPASDEEVDMLGNGAEDDVEENALLPHYLRPFAVTSVTWDATKQVKSPMLLRGVLRPYQQAGLEWLASLHANNLNGILSDEMGLGKTIQTIALLAHLACDQGIWGPHLIIVPTSVLLNWEMEFKKFLPGFKILSYHGNTKRRKELRQGWNNKYHCNVCVTSYTLASRDAHIFKRKPWYYMVLDEAHMIKNFKSQRWSTLLMFRSFRRLLLTGTPLQNNLTELWALLQFLMSGTDFANLKEFGEWFSVPLEKAIEMGDVTGDDTQQRVSKLHTVLRPYLLRRLKRDVEKELPSKYEHLVLCPLSKRQRFLYDEFMARADTRHDLASGVYQKIANILMQLRKVCNHPDLFEVRPIVTSFAMNRSAIADYEIKELLVRRHLLQAADEDGLNLDVLGLRFIDDQDKPWIAAVETRRLDGTPYLPHINDVAGEPPPKDARTIEGYKCHRAFQLRSATITRWAHIGYLNRLRCSRLPIYCRELVGAVNRLHQPLLPLSAIDLGKTYMSTIVCVHAAIKPYIQRCEDMAVIVNKFAFATPAVVANDLPRIALAGHEEAIMRMAPDIAFDEVLHRASVKLQIAFPDPSLLQYDCGKLQQLTQLLRERKAGGHRVLIFTQMTRILDILELFLNFHGYLYLRLDGATKIEDRQYITERFNSDSRIFCFISSSRSGGIGINLTGADTVIFYDSDFNPQMDRQCEDRAHRIGQIRDVHIYRFISEYTVEEALLRKANQKRFLDDLVIQKGEFDWRSLFGNESALNSALGEVEDEEDAHAAALATKEALALEGADEADFGVNHAARSVAFDASQHVDIETGYEAPGMPLVEEIESEVKEDPVGDEDEGGTCVDYMLSFIRQDMEFFRDWKL